MVMNIKNTIFKKLLITAVLGGSGMAAMAQKWCVPPQPVTGPFTGIKYVVLGTLKHNSSDSDGYTYYTGVNVPTLSAGSSQTVEVTTGHDIMGVGFTDKLNVRVWIDWNQDGDFTDAGETVLSKNMADPGMVNATFTVPAGAVNGTTRMRVYNDMPYEDGHDNPTPCGYLGSGNSLGQHGECQDYDVQITGGVASISEVPVSKMTLFPNPATNQITIDAATFSQSSVKVEVYDVFGRKCIEQEVVYTVGGISVSIEHLGIGTYYIKAYQEGMVYCAHLQKI